MKSDDYTFPPSNIMRTAATPANGGDSVYLQLKYDAFSYLVYLHFAEFEPNRVRTFDIIVNGGVQNEAFQPSYRKSEVVQQENDTNADKTLEVWIKRSNGSALPPILNAIEIYTIKDFSLQLETDPTVCMCFISQTDYILLSITLSILHPTVHFFYVFFSPFRLKQF